MATVSQVAVNKLNAFGQDDWRVITVERYAAIDIKRRTELILEGRVRFFDDDGSQIPVREALTRLRAQLNS
jgi:hypothetical protein